MIAVHQPMYLPEHSSYAACVRYMLDPQGVENRVGNVTISNCISDDVDMAVDEILATQQSNRRAISDRTYHMFLSFPAGEQPEPFKLRLIEEAVCKTLGLEDHQRISVCHHDTDHFHLHIAINKIHPQKLTMREPYNAYDRLAKTCARLEKQLGLRTDNHERTGKTKGERKSVNIEKHTGQESFSNWIRRECLADIQQATTWEELHQAIGRAGLEIRVRANGLAFFDKNGNSTTSSSVDRSLSKKRLEDRLGAFKQRAGEVPPVGKEYDKRPLFGEESGLWEQFTASRATNATEKDARRKASREEYRSGMAALKEANRIAMTEIRRIPVGKAKKQQLYQAQRAKHQALMNQLRRDRAAHQREISRKFGAGSWVAWLQVQAEQGNGEALTLLRSRATKTARAVSRAIRGDHPSDDTLIAGMTLDKVTKTGTVIYAVGESSLRDFGHQFTVSPGTDTDTAAMALSLAKERFGQPLRLDGDSKFRHAMLEAAVAHRLDITFQDAALEARRREMISTTKTQPNSIGADMTKYDRGKNNRRV